MSAIAVALVLAAPVPVPSREPDPPALVAQARPAGELLEQVKAYAKLAGGDGAVSSLEANLAGALGEKGFTGLDTKRPLAGYAYLTPKPEECWGVVVLPVTDEKAFLALAGRLTLKLDPVKESPGVYALTDDHDFVRDVAPVRVRVHDGSAYVAVNAPPSALEPKNLIPPGKLIDDKEPGFAAVRARADKVPPELVALAKETLEMLRTKVGKFRRPRDAWATDFSIEFLTLGDKYLDLAAGADKLTLRGLSDPKTGRATAELALTATPGSKLAKLIEGRPEKQVHRFAGLVPDGAVAWATGRLPTFEPDLTAAAEKAYDGGMAQARGELPEAFHPLFDAVRAGVAGTAKAGDADFAGALIGPDPKTKLYTAVGAMAFADPAAAEKAARETVKNLPEAQRALVTFDAAKAGTLSVHTVALGKAGLGTNDGPKKAFGEDLVLHVAFGEKAVYAAVGPNAVAEIARVAALKPAEAAVIDVGVNPKKWVQFHVDTSGRGATDWVKREFGDFDGPVPLYLGEARRDGATLTVRLGSGVFRLPMITR